MRRDHPVENAFRHPDRGHRQILRTDKMLVRPPRISSQIDRQGAFSCGGCEAFPCLLPPWLKTECFPLREFPVGPHGVGLPHTTPHAASQLGHGLREQDEALIGRRVVHSQKSRPYGRLWCRCVLRPADQLLSPSATTPSARAGSPKPAGMFDFLGLLPTRFARHECPIAPRRPSVRRETRGADRPPQRPRSCRTGD